MEMSVSVSLFTGISVTFFALLSRAARMIVSACPADSALISVSVPVFSGLLTVPLVSTPRNSRLIMSSLYLYF